MKDYESRYQVYISELKKQLFRRGLDMVDFDALWKDKGMPLDVLGAMFFFALLPIGFLLHSSDKFYGFVSLAFLMLGMFFVWRYLRKLRLYFSNVFYQHECRRIFKNRILSDAAKEMECILDNEVGASHDECIKRIKTTKRFYDYCIKRIDEEDFLSNT